MSENINSKLWDAASNGNEARVILYIEQGAEVDWRDDVYSATALHAAAGGQWRLGEEEVAKETRAREVARLLDSGWSLEASDKDGNTPLFCPVL